MKNILLFTLFSILLMSCGESGTGNPEIDTISIGTAFGIVSKSFSYWLFIILSLIPTGVYMFLYYRKGSKMQEISLPVLFGCLVLVMLAIFVRPAEIAANTSIAAYGRGNIIGY